MNRAAKHCASAALLTLMHATACDGLGRAVVDYEPPPPPLAPSTMGTCKAPECDRPLIEIELDPSVATRLHRPSLTFCGAEHDPCALAENTPETDENCRNGEIGDPRALAGESVHCGDLTFVPSGASACAVRAEGVELERSIVRLRSQEACKLELPGVFIRNTRIELEGPVTLVIGERARLEDSAFAGIRTTEGAPLLELDLSAAERTVIGDEEAPFEGMLSVRRTTLIDSSLRAEEVALESPVFLGAQLHADVVDAVDAAFSSVVLDLGEAVFAGGSLDRVDVRSCSALLIAACEISSSRLRGCGEGLMRIYDSTVANSGLDGWIESDSSIMDRVQLGQRSATNLVQFGGVINAGAFCPQASSYRLGAYANNSCSRCERDALEAGGVCAVSTVDNVKADAAVCPLIAELEMCTDDDLLPNRPIAPHRLPIR